MHESVVTVPEVELNTGQTSFPSGHSMAAFGLYSLLALIGGKKGRYWALLWAIMAAAVGLSRIFLVQHFLADILAGGVLGLFVGALVWRLNELPFLARAHWLDGRLFARSGQAAEPASKQV
jgi:membrane-associated phospholipid phosphatase